MAHNQLTHQKETRLAETMTRPLAKMSNELSCLKNEMLAHRDGFQRELLELPPEKLAAAQNLIDYIFLRKNDLFSLQLRLARYGFSSLGRMEHDVLLHLSQVCKVVDHFASSVSLGTESVAPLGDSGAAPSVPVPFELEPYVSQGQAELARACERLFGKHAGSAAGSDTSHVPCFMITLPKKALGSVKHSRALIKAGLHIGRFNLAKLQGTKHAVTAEKAVAALREAAQLEKKEVRVSFELNGPKVRVRKIRIQKKRACLVLGIPNTVQQPEPNLESKIGCLKLKGKKVENFALAAGDSFEIFWPRSLGEVRQGNRFVFDDGQAEACVTFVHNDAATPLQQRFVDTEPVYVRVEAKLTAVHSKKFKIKLGQGCMSHDIALKLPALTPADLKDLETILPLADLVAVSFIRSAKDVRDFYQELEKRNRLDIGVIFKIETSEACQNLPVLLLEILRFPNAAVMIARGDLALEIGFGRLLEMQQEILWFCAAARLPVVWATQVLENLTTTGIPTRAEISDVAQAAEADCIMLNRGEFLLGSIGFLKTAINSAQRHKDKRFAKLRKLGLAEKAVLH